MIEYPKITGPYRRYTSGPERNRPVEGDWARPELGELQHLDWSWTEKVDGTNIRLGWDGHQVSVRGRTDQAQIPAPLARWIEANVHEELLEQQFGSTPVTLFGEGYGPGIQKMGASYGDEQRYVLFDARIDGWWLLRPSLLDIASGLGLDLVPEVCTGTVADAVERVRHGVCSMWGDFPAEGLVGRTRSGLCDRSGERIMMKVKRAGPSTGSGRRGWSGPSTGSGRRAAERSFDRLRTTSSGAVLRQAQDDERGAVLRQAQDDEQRSGPSTGSGRRAAERSFDRHRTTSAERSFDRLGTRGRDTMGHGATSGRAWSARACSASASQAQPAVARSASLTGSAER